MKRLFSALGLVVLLLSPTIAFGYPDKPVRLIVPFPPGGVTDIAARVIGQKLSEQWGQQVIVENRPGAGGMIGVDLAVRSPADGYTLLMATNGEFTINPAVYAKMPYDPQKDVVPIIMATSTPLMWVANANTPINSIPELIAAAKGQAWNHRLFHARQWDDESSDRRMVPAGDRHEVSARPLQRRCTGWRRQSPSGEVPVGVVAILIGAAIHQVRQGERFLGLTTAKRSARAADWPTAAESGVQDFDAAIWVGSVRTGRHTTRDTDEGRE